MRFRKSYICSNMLDVCKKQTSVSHSSTESEIISLDAELRLDGIIALDLWDLIVSVFGNTNQSHKEQLRDRGDPLIAQVSVTNESNLEE